MPQESLNIQCFVKQEVTPIFTGENQPKLLYVSEVRPAVSNYPRVMHAHEDEVEVTLICSGTSDYLIHDKKTIICKGDVLIYNSGVVHDVAPSTEVTNYCMGISGLHMPGLRENALIPDDIGYVFPSGEYFEELQSLFQLMYRSILAGKPGCEQFCTGLMQALLSDVLTLTGSKDAPAAPPIEPGNLGLRIKEYIDAHYMEPITLQSMGEALHISSYYLSHVFKEMTGYSPVQYLLQRRIGEAQTLLASTDLSITRIAEMVGYDTQSYFNYQFTKNVGMSPNKYRQSYIVPSDIPKKKHRPRK